jgi:hypothetical protein
MTGTCSHFAVQVGMVAFAVTCGLGIFGCTFAQEREHNIAAYFFLATILSAVCTGMLLLLPCLL